MAAITLLTAADTSYLVWCPVFRGFSSGLQELFPARLRQVPSAVIPAIQIQITIGGDGQGETIGAPKTACPNNDRLDTRLADTGFTPLAPPEVAASSLSQLLQQKFSKVTLGRTDLVGKVLQGYARQSEPTLREVSDSVRVMGKLGEDFRIITAATRQLGAPEFFMGLPLLSATLDGGV
ncbi:hypothetical protein Bbelb_108490 [Branchiostoma belcheri]|nr:hypothetical protein Bbelb_108490 [Branchiostoma belcheri]